MLRKTIKKTTIALTTAALALTVVACAPKSEEVSPFAPNDDEISTLPPSKDAVAGEEEKVLVGDENGPLEEQPEEGEVLDIDEVVKDPDAYAEQPPFGTGAIIMGMSPEEIEVPDEVKKEFTEEEYSTLAESALRFIYKGFANKALQKNKFDEVDTPLILLDYYKNDFTEYGYSEFERVLYDHSLIDHAWALAPFLSNTGGFVIEGENYPIDTSEDFVGELLSTEIKNTVSESPVEGDGKYALFEYELLTFIPLEDTHKMGVQQFSISLAMVPRKDGDGWVVADWYMYSLPRALTVD